MGFFDVLFRSDSGGKTTKVRRSKQDNAKRRGDQLNRTGGGKHTHQSYNLDTSTGDYREYTGGDNSSDRSYNK